MNATGQLTLTLCLSLLAGSLNAAHTQQPDEATIQRFARDALITEDTAKRQLMLQDLAGQLESKLSEKPWFAGMYIEHQPRFWLTILTTGNIDIPKTALHGTVAPLAGVTTIRRVPRSLGDLRLSADQILASLQKTDVPADLEIDIESNQIILSTPDKPLFINDLRDKRVKLPSDLIILERDIAKLLAGSIPGGVSLQNCTSGFGLVNPSNSRAISTAGHCYNVPASYQGVSLPLGNYKVQGQWDVAWHSTPSFTPTNLIWNGSAYISITSFRAYGSQTIGEYLCKGGRVTGVQCGYIRSKTLAPSYITNPQPTFIALGNASMQGVGGDSGGPIWKQNVAYGVLSGIRTVGGENQIVYMSADKIYPAIGYYILVTP